VAAAFEVPRDRLMFMNQCHGTDVAVVDGPWDAEEAPRVDAVVTARDDLVLAALTADCVPVLLADPVAGVVGAVHAGRPGMIARVIDRAVDALVAAGATPGDTVAVVGPSVCGRCYEVPEGMRAAAAAVSPPSATVSWTGTPAIDVAAGVVDQLTRQGLPVTWVPGCTRESPDLFSYRRDATTGRFAGVVRLLPGEAA
jgi:YfiH family protein